MTRIAKVEKRKERRAARATKKGQRSAATYMDRKHPDQRCNDCGGMMPWCSVCECYTQSCCVDWGTCMCS